MEETGDFTLGAWFKGRRCRVLYLFFQLKMALPTCALAVKALAVSARVARSERGPAEEVQGKDSLGRTRVSLCQQSGQGLPTQGALCSSQKG